ncbi:MAG: hypothetical protein ABI181_05490 [Mycobacteriaceae bacterium]
MAVAEHMTRAVLADLREEPGWDAAQGGVLRAVRRSQRRSFPVLAEMVEPAGSRVGDRLLVSEQVLRVMLARAVAAALPCVVTDVRTELARTELRGLHLVVRAGYGASLHQLAAQVRTHALAAVAEVLGPQVAARVSAEVNVRVDDVTAADPRSL